MPVTKSRTWSRQVACVLILGCFYLGANNQAEVLQIVIWPVTVFTLAAFGLRQPAVASWMRGSQPTESPNGGRS
jgi:hypothetical protein